MSRSTTPLLKEIFTGTTLVAITEIKKHPDGIFIRFSSGQNKHFDKIYDYTSKEFLKMCGAAETITDHSVFSVTDIGKRLWICVKEVWKDEDNVDFILFDTLAYLEGTTEPPKIDESLFKEINYVKIIDSWSKISTDKSKIIAEQREMIKKVEGKKNDPDNFDIM